jgi:YVTN family beta-propeller protein/cysteine-rich repeat protein
MQVVTFRRSLRCVLLAVLVTAPRVAGAQSTDLGSYVLFATDEMRARGLAVERGDVGVNNGPLFVRTGVILDAPTSEVSADQASIPSDAICRRLVARLPGNPAPACPAEGIFTPPFADGDAVGAACGFPAPFPDCDPARTLEILPGETRVIDPGSYGQVVVRSSGSARGRLVFRPGTYQLCGLRTARGAELDFEGPTTLQVAGTVRFGTQSLVNFNGIDSHLVNLIASGSIVRLARDAKSVLRLCAPFSTLRMGRGVFAAGRYVARSIVAAGLQAVLPTTTTTSTSSSTTTTTSTSSTTTTSTSTSSTTSTSTSSSTTTSSTSSSSSSSSSTTSSTTSTSTSTSSSSTTSTVPPRCGDGTVNQQSEECDDGNTTDDDCCSTACLSAPDGGACGAGDLCSGDATCQSGVCTPTAAADALECRVPFSSALITNFDDGTATAIELFDGAVGAPAPVGRGAWGVAVHPAGEEIWVTAREDDRITILDAADYSVRATLDLGSLPLGIVFDPSGAHAYVASFGDDRVLVVDAATRAQITSIAVGNGPSGVVLDAAASRLYVSNYGGNSISVIDLASQRVVSTIKTKKRPLELALDTTRGLLYVTNFAADRVQIIGTISDSVLATVRVGESPFGVALDVPNNRAYVSNAISDTVSVVDGATCTETAVIPVGDGPLGIGLDLPGTRALVANSNDASLSLIDTASNAVTGTVTVGATPVAFGSFVGARANDCPRAPLLCDDANPMTLDSCAEVGCRFQPLPPVEAADVGLTTLDTTVREVGAEPLGGTTRAVLLGKLVVGAHTALTEGSGTPAKRMKRADRSVKRFTQVVSKGIRRRKVSCEVGQAILDLSRGVRVQLRVARTGSAR